MSGPLSDGAASGPSQSTAEDGAPADGVAVSKAKGGATSSEADGDDEDADEDSDETGGGGAKKGKKQGSFWKELPVLIGVALVLALVIKTFVVQAFYIPSESMENTLLVGDRVLVNKLVYHTRDIERGDVVVFSGLDSWDPEINVAEPSNPVSKVLRAIGSTFGVVPGEKDYIKRVIGVQGDQVKCCDAQGRITVNGVPIDEKSYLYTDPLTGEQNKPSDLPFEVTVGTGQLWVMGDHRELSYDSRNHRGDPGGGTVPVNRVIGRAFVIVWPLNRIDTLPIPKTFDRPALNHAAAGGLPMLLGLAGAVPIILIRRRLRLRASSG
ncbi:signal peptidase I [Spirillospora sp. NPDC047279]|uniref:signal peptidase I n=1 Tax=Spirillospora sp. NPDC047279 TaxID=3155478 RepID=UPI0033E1599E